MLLLTKRARCVPSSSSSPLGRFSCFPLTPPAHMLSTQRAPPMLPSRRACCNHRAGRPHGALLRVLCCVQRVLGGVEEGVVWDVVWDEAWRAHPLRHPRICVIGVVSLPRDVPGMVYLPCASLVTFGERSHRAGRCLCQAQQMCDRLQNARGEREGQPAMIGVGPQNGRRLNERAARVQ